MGLMTGGILIQQSGTLTNADILALLDREELEAAGEISLEEATSGTFHDTAIGRKDKLTIILGRDLLHSISLEDESFSPTDKKLLLLSHETDILCFLANSVSELYAWSIFRKGKRQRVVTAISGAVAWEAGSPTVYDKGLACSDQGIYSLVANFAGMPYIQLVYESQIRATVYRAQ